jgi:hypothetical protein
VPYDCTYLLAWGWRLKVNGQKRIYFSDNSTYVLMALKYLDMQVRTVNLPEQTYIASDEKKVRFSKKVFFFASKVTLIPSPRSTIITVSPFIEVERNDELNYKIYSFKL